MKNYFSYESHSQVLKRQPSRRGRLQAGFTLIEILVALLVLSVGLLGLAGMQARGLQNNQNAFLRSRAVQGGADILDRMRANLDPALNGNYNIAKAEVPAEPGGGATMAQIDLWQWKRGLAASLPLGDGRVAVAANIATITVFWTEGNEERIVTLVTRL